MKICRFNNNKIGVVTREAVCDVSAIIDELPTAQYPYPNHDLLVENLGTLKDKLLAMAQNAPRYEIENAAFLSPVANPTKIIGAPVNYRAHHAEAQADAEIKQTPGKIPPIEKLGLFLKANSALVGPSQGIAVRFSERRTDHEAELGVIIGKQVSDISEHDALTCVAGYALAMDMVVRGTQDRSFRKSIDSYAVLGPWLVTPDEITDPQNLDIELSVNGRLRQQANTQMMLMTVAQQIAWASRYYTLFPGDILMTGTPEGVAPVVPGDTVDMTISGIGAMQVRVRAHTPPA